MKGTIVNCSVGKINAVLKTLVIPGSTYGNQAEFPLGVYWNTDVRLIRYLNFVKY